MSFNAEGVEIIAKIRIIDIVIDFTVQLCKVLRRRMEKIIMKTLNNIKSNSFRKSVKFCCKIITL